MPEKEALSILDGFNALEEQKRVVTFIKEAIKRINKNGAVIGLSGGLDSTTVAYLCKEAIGPQKMLGLIMPERDSSEKNMADAERIADELGIPCKKIDITPIVEHTGAYGLFPQKESLTRSSIERSVGRIKKMLGKETLLTEMDALRGAPVIGDYPDMIYAFATVKTKVRMMMLYYYAALSNFAVVGTTDLSEWTIGFYDKYGDGACDISPLKHLYKTQIRAVAKSAGVPEYILTKPSSGDLMGEGLPNETIIGMSYEKLDAVLVRIKRGLSDDEIMDETGISKDTLQSISKAISRANMIENMPLTL